MYPKVLRQIVCNFYHRNHFSIRYIAIMFNISKSTIGRWIKNSYVPHKSILMDNIRFHKTKELVQVVLLNKSKLLFIPPYSPQFNSIEYVFNIIKTKFRQLNNNTDCLKLINNILFSVTFYNIYSSANKLTGWRRWS